MLGVGPQPHGAPLCLNSLVRARGREEIGFRDFYLPEKGTCLLSILRPDFLVNSKPTSSASMDCRHQLPISCSHGPVQMKGVVTAHSQRMYAVEVDVRTDPLINFSTFKHQHWQQRNSNLQLKALHPTPFRSSSSSSIFVMQQQESHALIARYRCHLDSSAMQCRPETAESDSESGRRVCFHLYNFHP